MLKIWHLMSFTRVASHHQCCLSTAALKVHICWAFQQDSCYIHIASLCCKMETKKTCKILIIQLVYDKLMWGWNILLTYLNYSCSKQRTTDLRHQNKALGQWHYLKYYHVLTLISCNLLIWSIQIMEGGFTNKKVLTEKDKNCECLRTCNHERRQTKLIRWINSLPTETFKKNWAIYFRQKIGKLANNIMLM